MKSKEERVHLWANTAISALALIVSLGSAAMSWLSYDLKNEALALRSKTADCKLRYTAQTVSLCWAVSFSNMSDSRMGVIALAPHPWRGVNGLANDLINELEDMEGKRIPLPITLDAGESKLFLLRANARMSQDSAKRLAALKTDSLQQAMVAIDFPDDSHRVPKESNLPKHSGGPYVFSELRAKSGRGKTFRLLLMYPDDRVNSLAIPAEW